MLWRIAEGGISRNIGGRVLLYFEGKDGSGLYRVGYGDLDPEDAVWVATDLQELLATGTGMHNL